MEDLQPTDEELLVLVGEIGPKGTVEKRLCTRRSLNLDHDAVASKGADGNEAICAFAL